MNEMLEILGSVIAILFGAIVLLFLIAILVRGFCEDTWRT